MSIGNIYFLVKVREAAELGVFSESVAEIRRHDMFLYTGGVWSTSTAARLASVETYPPRGIYQVFVET